MCGRCLKEVCECRQLRFVCVDDWSRPIFKDDEGYYFCSVDKLVSTQEELEAINEDDLVYHGRDLDNDPNGGKVRKIRIVR